VNRVAILGAGIAGIAAARRLVDEGLEVTLFDKGRGPGGRTSVRRADRLQFDHGAQYFTVCDPEFGREVEGWIDRGVVEEWTGRIVAIDAGGTSAPTGPRRRLVGVPGMNAVARHLAQDLRVETGRPVSGLRRGPRGWQVVRGEEETGFFDAVLVTLPPAQAVPFLKSAPDLAQRARRVRMRPCWAVMAAFAGKIEAGFDGAFVNIGPLSWVARDSSKPGRPDAECWVLHAGTEWSVAHLEDEVVDVERKLLEAFAAVAGLEQLPVPVHLDAMRWRFAIPDEPLPGRAYLDPVAGIGIAGDWCGGPRVEGAWLSGRELARRLLEAGPTLEDEAR
jgi:predicted NAD/FAD-dependent oxidoreductase